MKVLRESDRLHPYPRGWYAVGTGFDLKPGELRHTAFMGQQLIYFRTESGTVNALDAYCKHAGTHLGHGGKVKGEMVVCPYHHFHWGSDGKLAHVPGMTKCPRLQQKSFPVDEKWGYVMVWHDPDGGPPNWTVPAVVDTKTWSNPLIENRILDVHPVDVAENSSDMRHFHALHHNDFNLQEIYAVDADHFHALYTGKVLEENKGLEFYHRIAHGVMDVHLYGLGVLTVQVTLPDMGLGFHYMVSPLPLDENRTQLMIGVNMRRSFEFKGKWLDRALPGLNGRIRLPFVDRLVHLWRQDFLRSQLEDEPIWGHKVYMAEPGFMDPPVQVFRKWAAGIVKPLNPDARHSNGGGKRSLPVTDV
ncbi:MAG: Rieske 2Fe-2S domain-containing protein [Myxococcales bacterium]